MSRTATLSVVVVVVLLLTAGSAAAQSTTGSVRGVVTDPQGAVLPGVTVVAISDALVAGQLSAVTSTQGVYRFPSLPPGTYVLEAHMPGFRSVRRDGVSVGLGQTLDVDLQMGDVTVSGEIVVVADAVQVSTVSNNVGFNMDKTFIERQPLSRDPAGLMNYAPGINNDQAYGAPSTYQNAYNLDGVDVSDPELGSQWVFPNMDWVQEVQVAGLGADAEYGGFTGAVVNLVTKSGGNELHGDVRAYYSGGGLNAENAPPGVEGANKLSSDWEGSVSLGGKIITDKLWFFVSASERKRTIDPFFSAGAPDFGRESTVREWTQAIGKLTYQANEANRGVLLVDYDAVDEDYRGVGDLTLADAAEHQDSPSYSFNGTWESLIDDANFVTAKLTGYKGQDDRRPHRGDEPGRYDLDSGFEWVNLAETGSKDVKRTAFDVSWSLFADGLITSGDSHNFKFGGTYEDLSSDYVTHVNGGFTYVDDSYYGGYDGWGCATLGDYFADPNCALYSSDRGGEWDLHGRMSGMHLYAQDSWQVGRVTVNYGARYTHYTGGFADVSGNVYDQDMIAPRVGLVWDVGGAGRAAVKLHYGRYYEGMAVVFYDREASGAALTDTEYWDWDFATGQWVQNGGTVNAWAQMADNLTHPSVEQFVATFEHEVGSDMVVGVDYIRRRYDDILAMYTSNVGDYDALVAPNNPLGGGDLPFYELLEPPQYVIGNPAGAKRDYDSAALRFRKRYSHGWYMDASLVWSDLTGNADWALAGYADDFQDLNGTINAQGRLPYNSDWVLKVSGSVDLPWKMLASAFYVYRTGEYWTPYVRIRGLLENDRTGVFMTERGSRQLPDRSDLDLHLEKLVDLASGLELAVMVDVFNVFNDDAVTSVVTRWGDYRYQWDAHPEESEWRPNDAFATPTDIQSPRAVRVGARVRF